MPHQCPGLDSAVDPSPGRLAGMGADFNGDLYSREAAVRYEVAWSGKAREQNIRMAARKIKRTGVTQVRFVVDMTNPLKQVQPVLAYSASHVGEDLSLGVLAGHARLSAFHLHRVFSATAGETPKQFTTRLRLGRAAAMLLATGDSVLNIALACGFQSHETFCRAFRKGFRMTPSAYRARGFAGEGASRATEHSALINTVGPCIKLFHTQQREGLQKNDMPYAITKKEIEPQPVLVVRRRIKPPEVAATLAEVLGKVFMLAQRNGVGLAGPPLTRYLEWGPGIWTIEAGMPVTTNVAETSDPDVRADTLPGGLVATTMHTGSYDRLTEAYAAVQQWIEAEGLAANGAPWESYVTDPAEYPDPTDWRTEIFWPVASAKR